MQELSSLQPRPGPALLVGLDVGTTHVKAALVTAAGEVLHVARRPTPVRRLRAGRSAHPAGELVAAIEAVVRECVGTAVGGGAAISGIGIASMAEAGTLVDRRGEPILDVIPWFDPRSDGEAAELQRLVGAAELFAMTGLRAHGKYSLPKLMWLRSSSPAAFRRARSWAGVAELAGLHLGGGLATNASLACRTLAFDVTSREWSAELLAFASFSADRMPEVLPFGRPAGGLRRDAASRLGLRSGIPIVVAGHDHVVGALGAGVVRPGQALDSMGSAEACLVVTERPSIADELRVRGYSVGCHVLDDRAYVLAGLQASGALVEWFIDTFLGDLGEAERYPAFLRLLEAGEGLPTAGNARVPLPARAVVLPYPRGRTAPRPDLECGLDVLGLRDGDGLPQIARALVDGAACAVHWIFEELQDAAGVGIGATTVIGGGARNARWLAAKAALAPGPLLAGDVVEAVALGAALAAGVGAGVFATPEDSLRHAAAGRVIRRPRSTPAFVAYYTDRFLPAANGAGAG